MSAQLHEAARPEGLDQPESKRRVVEPGRLFDILRRPKRGGGEEGGRACRPLRFAIAARILGRRMAWGCLSRWLAGKIHGRPVSFLVESKAFRMVY